MIPIVNGKEERFGPRGLFNGLELLGDYTTDSFWDHITGECLLGELKGAQLEFTDFDLLYTTVDGAIKMSPNTQLALSDSLSLMGHFAKFVTPYFHKVLGNRLPFNFARTLDVEDMRRERMDLGLGLWTNKENCYYPLEVIKAETSGIFDTLDGRSIFVYYNSEFKAPDAVYVDATTATSQDGGYVFDTGDYLLHGNLYDSAGQRLSVKRPHMMFTRWYGFSLTFPNVPIYGQ